MHAGGVELFAVVRHVVVGVLQRPFQACARAEISSRLVFSMGSSWAPLGMVCGMVCPRCSKMRRLDALYDHGDALADPMHMVARP